MSTSVNRVVSLGILGKIYELQLEKVVSLGIQAKIYELKLEKVVSVGIKAKVSNRNSTKATIDPIRQRLHSLLRILTYFRTSGALEFQIFLTEG